MSHDTITCKHHVIFAVSFSREAQNWPTVFTDPVMVDIAKKHNKTPAQVNHLETYKNIQSYFATSRLVSYFFR